MEGMSPRAAGRVPDRSAPPRSKSREKLGRVTVWSGARATIHGPLDETWAKMGREVPLIEAVAVSVPVTTRVAWSVGFWIVISSVIPGATGIGDDRPAVGRGEAGAEVGHALGGGVEVRAHPGEREAREQAHQPRGEERGGGLAAEQRGQGVEPGHGHDGARGHPRLPLGPPELLEHQGHRHCRRALAQVQGALDLEAHQREGALHRRLHAHRAQRDPGERREAEREGGRGGGVEGRVDAPVGLGDEGDRDADRRRQPEHRGRAGHGHRLPVGRGGDLPPAEGELVSPEHVAQQVGHRLEAQGGRVEDERLVRLRGEGLELPDQIADQRHRRPRRLRPVVSFTASACRARRRGPPGRTRGSWC